MSDKTDLICDACGTTAAAQLTERVALCPHCSDTGRHEEIKVQTELYRLLERADARRLITQLTIHDRLTQWTMTELNIDTIAAPPRLLRHCLGLVWEFAESQSKYESGLEQDNSSAEDAPVYRDVISELRDIALEYIQLDAERIRGDDADDKSTDPKLEIRVRDRDMWGGRYATGPQERRVAENRYSRFESTLQSLHRFTIDDAISFVQNIEYLLVRPPILLAPFEESLRSYSIDGGDPILLSEFEEAIIRDMEKLGEEYLDQFWHSHSDIVSVMDDLPSDDILNRLASPFGDGGGVAATENPYRDPLPYRCPFDLNPTERYLFVARDVQKSKPSTREFLLAAPSISFATLAKTFFYDVQHEYEEKGRIEEFRREWSQSIEDLTINALRNLFPSELIHSNVNYVEIDPPNEVVNKKTHERDVVVTASPDHILVECKARVVDLGLGTATRTGRKSFEQLWSTTDTTLRKATDQLSLIRQGANIPSGKPGHIGQFSSNDEVITLASLYELLPIVVLDDHIGIFTTADYEQMFVSSAQFVPYMTDYYTLDSIARQSTPNTFVEYVRRRIELLEGDSVINTENTDELDLYWNYEHGLLSPAALTLFSFLRIPSVIVWNSLNPTVRDVLNELVEQPEQAAILADAIGIDSEAQHARVQFSSDEPTTVVLPLRGADIRMAALRTEAVLG